MLSFAVFFADEATVGMSRLRMLAAWMRGGLSSLRAFCVPRSAQIP